MLWNCGGSQTANFCGYPYYQNVITTQTPAKQNTQNLSSQLSFKDVNPETGYADA